MFRRAARARSPGVELRELGGGGGGARAPPPPPRRSGYSPPRFAPPPARSPTGSTLTDPDLPRAPPPSSPPPRPAPPPPPPTPAPVDVITAQIHRALGRPGGSAVGSDSAGGSAGAPPGSASSNASAASDADATARPWDAAAHEEAFRAAVGGGTVDLDELRRVMWMGGAPRGAWARALAWKLLAGLLPPDRADWDAALRAKRARYWALVAAAAAAPRAPAAPAPAPAPKDHPLAAHAGSRWAQHFADARLRADIARDVARTHLPAAGFARLRDALARVLFVHARAGAGGDDGGGATGRGYRQGMHEVAAPLLAVFAGSGFADAGDAEADVFFCFGRVMAGLRGCYDGADNPAGGMGRELRELMGLLRIKDPRLARHLAGLGVDARFFAIRWIRLWLAREFGYADTLRIWDSLLTAEVPLPWLRYVCVAMMIRIRDELLAADFAGCMKLLLHYPACDVDELLRIADRLRTSNVVIVRSVKR